MRCAGRAAGASRRRPVGQRLDGLRRRPPRRPLHAAVRLRPSGPDAAFFHYSYDAAAAGRRERADPAARRPPGSTSPRSPARSRARSRWRRPAPARSTARCASRGSTPSGRTGYWEKDIIKTSLGRLALPPHRPAAAGPPPRQPAARHDAPWTSARRPASASPAARAGCGSPSRATTRTARPRTLTLAAGGRTVAWSCTGSTRCAARSPRPGSTRAPRAQYGDVEVPAAAVLAPSPSSPPRSARSSHQPEGQALHTVS